MCDITTWLFGRRHETVYRESHKPVPFQVVPDSREAISHLGLPQNWGEVWKLEIEDSSVKPLCPQMNLLQIEMKKQMYWGERFGLALGALFTQAVSCC